MITFAYLCALCKASSTGITYKRETPSPYLTFPTPNLIQRSPKCRRGKGSEGQVSGLAESLAGRTGRSGSHSPRPRQPSGPSQLSRMAHSSPSSAGGRSNSSVCADSAPRVPHRPAIAEPRTPRGEAGLSPPLPPPYTTAEIQLLDRCPELATRLAPALAGRVPHDAGSRSPGMPLQDLGRPPHPHPRPCAPPPALVF